MNLYIKKVWNESCLYSFYNEKIKIPFYKFYITKLSSSFMSILPTPVLNGRFVKPLNPPSQSSSLCTLTVHRLI